MKRLTLGVIALTLMVMMPQASAETSIVRVVAPMHQGFTGEFRNDDLAQSLNPAGDLGSLIFQSASRNRIWVIDPALIDQITVMSNEYAVANEVEPTGKELAVAWLQQLKQITEGNEVIALAYGNPDTSLAKKIAPSELRFYFAYGQDRLQLSLGRAVRSEPSTQWSIGKSGLNNVQRQSYTQYRQALTRLSRVVDSPEVVLLRAQLAQLLSPTLSKDAQEYFFTDASVAISNTLRKLRINSGKYQITTSAVKLPVTLINEFDVDITVDILMIPNNSRVIVESFDNVLISAKSKKQLEMQVDVVAPGQTLVSVFINDLKGNEVVPISELALNSTVIDPRVTWLTTGAAVLLLLAGAAQSVRRVRKRAQ